MHTLKRFFNKFVIFVIFLNTQVDLFILKTDVEKFTSTNKKTLHLIFKLQLITIGKLYISFRFVQKSMTMKDAERSKRIQSDKLITKRNSLVRNVRLLLPVHQTSNYSSIPSNLNPHIIYFQNIFHVQYFTALVALWGKRTPRTQTQPTGQNTKWTKNPTLKYYGKDKNSWKTDVSVFDVDLYDSGLTCFNGWYQGSFRIC